MNTITIGELLLIYEDSDPRHDLILTMGQLTPEKQLYWGQLLEFQLRQWLKTLAWLLQDDREVVIKLVTEDVHEHGQVLGSLDSPNPEYELWPLTIGFADRIWVTLSKWDCMYHVHSGDKIRGLTVPPLETLTMDLTALWYRHQEKIKSGRSRIQSAEATTNPEAPSTSPG